VIAGGRVVARPYQCDTAEAIAGRFKAACDAGYALPVLTFGVVALGVTDARRAA
jgi:hypothetical protein